MPPGSQPSGGIRESLKRRARRVKKWFGAEDQAAAPRAPAAQLQLPDRALPPQLTPTHELSPQPLAQTQSLALLTLSAPSASGSTSISNPVTADHVQSANAESRLTQAAGHTGTEAWTGLKIALQLLERSSGAFPPLKSAVAGFLGVIDVFETAAVNRSDYAKIASNLQAMVCEFAERPGEQTSSRMLEALDAMGNGLQEEMRHVQKQGQRSKFRRFLEVKQDSDDVQACYSRIENLRHALQDKAMLRMWRIGEEQQVDARLEKLDAALKATYDSKLSAVVGRRACTPGTRQAILVEMRKWANNPNGSKVYWLNGMAGTGKTTLAYSFCAEMQRTGQPAASFFCSRTDADSRDVSRIIPTIAYQLARLLPSYREVLIRQIGEDKDICARGTGTQFGKLIRDPLLEVEASVPEGIVVTIDALDECDRRDGAQEILNELFRQAGDLPIKFLVTSRPEPGLFDTLQSKDERHRSVFHLHDVEASFVRADIKTYLEAELGALSLSQEHLGQLAEQAGTLFIYAATAVRYIHPKGRQVDSSQRLEQLLSVVSASRTNKHKDIDDLYRVVLCAPFTNDDLEPREKENVRLVLDTTICARESMSVTAMAGLLGLGECEVMYALQHLRSVLHVSQDANLISTLHASFPDFMLDLERSKDLCCHAAKHHGHLSLRCFGTMQRLLRFNICELASSFVLDENIPNLAEKIENAILPELFYACRYWADHLVSAEARDDAHSALEGFLLDRLLFWMEVLNLKQCIHIGVRGLYRVQAWTQRINCPVEIQQLARDAAGFVTTFSSNPVSRSTPHIYISALPFWPEQRPISTHYLRKMKGIPKVTGAAMRKREAAPLVVCVTPGGVGSVAYSSDGARIVSGSGDNKIRIWDAHTGKMIGEPLEGHTGAVRSVAFSSNSARIISGSNDKTIRIWDAYTGKMIGEPLEGHSHAVWSVAFSHNNARIVSGSEDKTVRVWDAHTRKMIGGPLEGHADCVRSVAYSSDSARIVSGSDDNTIRIWDAHTGKMVGEPLEGHFAGVWSVAFSPNNARIVSGSEDKTVRVWDVHTRKMIGEPLEGHADCVMSVAYSPGSARIVSGSHDRTVRIWDARTGKMIGEPFGHDSGVSSVAYSPDGARIVSGSHDTTIRIWDVHTGKTIGEPLEGHIDSVWSVAYSPDSTRIVSGSSDTTIKIWDAHTGKMIGEPLEGRAQEVNSVAYSSDGARIVSGFTDTTIRIWDAHTGKMVGEPLEGHTNRVWSVAYSSGNAYIISGSCDKTMRIWDAHTGKMIGGPLEGHTEEVSSVACSSDGTRIVSGSSDTTIRIWDMHTGKMVGEPLEGHTDAVSSVMFSSDNARIVSGSHDKTVRIWDAHTGKMVGKSLEGHTNVVKSVAFSPDGARIVSGSFDKTIRIWDAYTGKMIGEPLEGHTHWVMSVAYSPDGASVVSGSYDYTIRIWDVDAGEAIGEPLEGHTDMATSVAHSSDNAYTVSGSSFNKIHRTNIKDASTDPRHTWVVDEDGFMLANGSKIVMWVPSDVRGVLMRPQNTAVISTQGSVKVHFTGTQIGETWAQCYQSA